MLLICLVLYTCGIPAGVHSGEILHTDLSGNSLSLGGELLSSCSGSGGNPISIDEELFWKECPPDSDQRIVNTSADIVYSRDFFSGPYPAPSEELMMISVPSRILLLSVNGDIIESFSIEGYPGSLASSEDFIWFISSETGELNALDTSTGIVSVIPLSFTPLTVSHRNSLLLLRRTEGGYSVTDTQGGELFRTEDGFNAVFLDHDAIALSRWSGGLGCQATAWETVVISPSQSLERFTVNPDIFSHRDLFIDDNPVAHFDVPYIHQRWDTPDWFNGSWSCGPTSCLMAAQYYNRLTPDSVWCSSPSGHWSSWGNYIPTEYTFLGYTYDIQGLAPGSVWVPGAHGFICRSYGGAGWNEMTWWLDQHGLDSSWLGTTWSACTGELDNGWPVVASTTSPYTGGHILLFNGYYENHSVICNDSYGNQNIPGWGTMINGKDVVYDWPGYNNGNTQLGISQLFSARSQPLAPAGVIIDDRTQGYEKLGPCQFWHEQTTGYNGYSWWTYSTGAPPDTCVVRWNPDLPESGEYLIEVWIPGSHATATGHYNINTSSGWQTVYLNQQSYSDQWAVLGYWQMNPSTAQVVMGDYTGTQGQYISFDALRFTLQGSSCEENQGIPLSSFTVIQNPVPASSQIAFTIPEDYPGEISVYSLDGRLLLKVTEQVPAGILQPGIYFAAINCHESNHEILRFTVTE